MSFVIFDRETTLIFDAKGHHRAEKRYATKAAARAACTRALKALARREPDTYIELDVAEHDEFFDSIEKKVERTNAMTGKKFMERANTSMCCSPSSELYFTM